MISTRVRVNNHLQENDRARLLWDASIPTDRLLVPDNHLGFEGEIWLLEMACAYDSHLEEQEK